MKNTEDRVREVIIDQVGCEPDDVRSEANIYTDLGLDSLDSVELVMALEKEFQIKLPDEKWNFSTVGELIAILESAHPA